MNDKNEDNYNHKDNSALECLKRFNLAMKEPDEHTKKLTELIGRELKDIMEDYPDCKILKIDSDTSVHFQIEVEEEEGTKVLYLESAKCIQAFFFPNNF